MLNPEDAGNYTYGSATYPGKLDRVPSFEKIVLLGTERPVFRAAITSPQLHAAWGALLGMHNIE